MYRNCEKTNKQIIIKIKRTHRTHDKYFEEGRSFSKMVMIESEEFKGCFYKFESELIECRIA